MARVVDTATVFDLGAARNVRGIYATMPMGLAPERFRPDAFLVAAALRPDAIFSHHSAPCRMSRIGLICGSGGLGDMGHVGIDTAGDLV